MKTKDLEKGVKNSFAKVKGELDEHLDAINQNTSELSAAYQYIAQLEAKIDKLSERLDELAPHTHEYPEAIQLTLREQEVFIILYTASEPLCIPEITKNLGLTHELVENYITQLASKGVPLLKKTVNELVFYALETNFKNLQARKGIVAVHESIAGQFV